MPFFLLMFSSFSHWEIVLGGTVIFFILGWLWYNPVTPIGKKWISYFPMPKGTPKPQEFIGMMILQLFMGFSITYIVILLWGILGEVYLHCGGINIECPVGFDGGLGTLDKTLVILKIYMGFVFIKDLGHWYFEKRPFPLVLIGVGYYFVGILGVCGLLSYFY